MCNTGNCFSPLNGYNRQRRFGFLASAGSLYFITTPLKVFVSSANLPVVSKFGSSFFATGFFSLVESLVPHT